MEIMDDATYATVTVAFSQPEQVFVQTIVNAEYITRTPFSARCKIALNSGAEIASSIAVGLIRVWPFTCFRHWDTQNQTLNKLSKFFVPFLR